MRDFKSDNRSRSRKPLLLHDAVCDECGKDCKVPFKPSSGKPIYCSDCFEKKGGRDNNRPRDRRDSSRRSFGNRDSRRLVLHDAVCDECGKDCKVPFKPSGDKPIYCSDCFEKKGGRDSNRPRDRRDRSTLQFIEKIEVLNTKLDTIINLLSLSGEKKSKTVKSRTKKNKNSKAKKKDTKKI